MISPVERSQRPRRLQNISSLITNGIRALSVTIASRQKSLEPQQSKSPIQAIVSKSTTSSAATDMKVKSKLSQKSMEILSKLRTSKSTSLKPARSKLVMKKLRTTFPAPKIIKLVPTKFKPVFGQNKKSIEKLAEMPLVVDPNEILGVTFRPKPATAEKPEADEATLAQTSGEDTLLPIEDIRDEILSHVEDWDEWYVESGQPQPQPEEEVEAGAEEGTEEDLSPSLQQPSSDTDQAEIEGNAEDQQQEVVAADPNDSVEPPNDPGY